MKLNRNPKKRKIKKPRRKNNYPDNCCDIKSGFWISSIRFLLMNIIYFFLPAREVKIPATHNTVNAIKMVFMLSMNKSRLSEEIFESPRKTCTDSAATAMLNIMPLVRIVATVAEARLKYFFSTELIIEFVFGDENMPKPKPKIRSDKIIYARWVSLDIKVSRSRPILEIPMPKEARILGSLLSDILPETDETTAMITGWAINIAPASFGDNPLTY